MELRLLICHHLFLLIIMLQLEQARLKAERLAEYIRSLGIDPDTL